MSGEGPLPAEVTRSPGTAADGFSAFSFSTSSLTRAFRALLVGPRLEPPELAALYGAETVLVESAESGDEVAEGRPWKYMSSLISSPTTPETTPMPAYSITAPFACVG